MLVSKGGNAGTTAALTSPTWLEAGGIALMHFKVRRRKTMRRQDIQFSI